MTMFDIHLRSLLWLYSPGHAGVKGNDRVDRLAGEARRAYITSWLSSRNKCWGAWDTTCGYNANDITPSITWKREACKREALDEFTWTDENGLSSTRPHCNYFKGKTRETSERWGGTHTGFPSAYIPFWTDLFSVFEDGRLEKKLLHGPRFEPRTSSNRRCMDFQIFCSSFLHQKIRAVNFWSDRARAMITMLRISVQLYI